jgi:hypothetical protein
MTNQGDDEADLKVEMLTGKIRSVIGEPSVEALEALMKVVGEVCKGMVLPPGADSLLERLYQADTRGGLPAFIQAMCDFVANWANAHTESESDMRAALERLSSEAVYARRNREGPR